MGSNWQPLDLQSDILSVSLASLAFYVWNVSLVLGILSMSMFLLQCAEHDPCFNRRCLNTEPGYQCYACPSGYDGTYEDGYAWNVHQRVFIYGNLEYSNLTYQTCDDIDECTLYPGLCPEHMPCVNTQVSGTLFTRFYVWKEIAFRNLPHTIKLTKLISNQTLMHVVKLLRPASKFVLFGLHEDIN